MNRREDIDELIASSIREEKNQEPNPFLATRVMNLIRNTNEKIKFLPVWQGVAMALSFVAAVALGIKAGSMYKSTSISNDETTVMYMSDDQMEHFGFYRQTLKN